MNPGALLVVTVGGKTFKCSQRTYAHILWTISKLPPGCTLRILQGCYSDGRFSAGTHDYDAVVDVEVVGMSWSGAQTFLRKHGWAAWWRHTGTWAARDRWHIHMISLGYPGKVGKYVDGGLSLTGRVYTSSQVDDYYRHSLGLKGQHSSGLDRSWFPPDINATIFNYSAWEDDMAFTDWPQKDQDALATAVANEVWAKVLDGLGGDIGSKDSRGLRQRRADGVLSAIYNRVGGGKKS